MNIVTLPSRNAPRRTLHCIPPAVYVEGRRRRDLHVLSWQVSPGPEFGNLSLSSRQRAADEPAARMEQLHKLPRIGSDVKVCPGAAAGGGEFIGVVVRHRVEVDEQDEILIAECSHRFAVDLSFRISSLWRRSDGQAEEVPQARICFNEGWNGRASDTVTTVRGRTCRVFDSATDSRPWSVADALAYLLASSLTPDAKAPSLVELEALAGNVELGTLEVTGKTAAESLAEVAHKAGLELRASREGKVLVFYQPGRQGRLRNVRLQAAGEDLDIAETNLWQGRIHIGRRPSTRGLVAIGQRKQYESTFDLSKGWDASLQTARWRDFVRSESDNWPAVADVYRKWVLNEHGWYSGGPWSLPVHTFADISAADFTVRVARRFLPCLSTDREGQSLGAVVEIRCGGAAPWRRWRGPLWASRNECAIYLGGDALPGEYFQAAYAGEVSVRVTATVEADTRLIAEIKGDPRAPREVIDLSSRAAWKRVHPSSIFFGAEDVGTPGEQDDQLLLERLARRRAEIASRAVEAEFRLGWIDASYHVGDIIDRIEGRQFELASSTDGKPCVCSVHHDFGPAQTTRLTVTG